MRSGHLWLSVPIDVPDLNALFLEENSRNSHENSQFVDSLKMARQANKENGEGRAKGRLPVPIQSSGDVIEEIDGNRWSLLYVHLNDFDFWPLLGVLYITSLSKLCLRFYWKFQ